MKKTLYFFFGILLLCGIYQACQPDVEVPGGISGTVTDKATGELIKSAGIELSPGGLKSVTGSEGQFQFTDIEPGKYTLLVTKTGYIEFSSSTIDVKAGKVTLSDIQLEKLPPALKVVDGSGKEITTLDFGASEADVARSFNLFNDGTDPLEWQITATAEWIKSFSKKEGTIAPGKTQSLLLTIDRSLLNSGKNTTTVHVTSNNGSKQLTVTATSNYVATTLNTLPVSDIKSNSAVLNGEILTNGTPKYTERGFVYSESSMPTINACIKKITSTLTDSTTFSEEIVGLTQGTTYFVRAYAINGGKEVYSSNEVSFTPMATSLPQVTTKEVTNISKLDGKATFLGSIESVGDPAYTKRGFVYGVLHNPTVENDTNVLVVGTGTGEFMSNVSGLSLGNVYYVRAYAANSLGVAYGKELVADFSPSAPVVTTNAVECVPNSETDGTATFSATITDAGVPLYTERGFVYSQTKNPTVNTATKVTVAGSGTGQYSTNVDSLEVNKTYYVCAYLVHQDGVAYGEEKSFIIQVALTPTVATSEIKNVSYASATAGGNVSFDGGLEVTERGVCYSTSTDPTISDTKVIAGTGTGAFTCELTGLGKETTYYVRAYAMNTKGLSYGDQVSFQTKTPSLPIVTTTAAKNITYTTATIEAEVRESGGSEVVERGVCYSLSSNPTTSDTKIVVGSGVGTFVANLTDLSVETTYYVRAYATNAKGTSYGEEVVFQTDAYSVPTVLTTEAAYITNSSATVGGNVIADGGTEVTERGICYSLSTNPTLSDIKIEAGNGKGTYSVELKGLSMATTYYARAYAINSKGISYGEQVSFQTITGSLPTVTTISVVNVTYSSASVNGMVTLSDDIIEYGICYSLSPNPTINELKVVSTSESAVFSINLTNLSDGTTYYVRAYATNNIGTAYGEEVSFTTKAKFYENGYEYVDLGLSVKWATCNVGATKPEEVGYKFAWGDIIPNRGGSWGSYVHCYDAANNLTKYCTDSLYGTVDNKTTLEPVDDAAHIHWGGNWRMPTQKEVKELIDNCSVQDMWIGDCRCFRLVSRVAGYTDKSIILVMDTPYGKNDYKSCYWTSNYDNIFAITLYLYSYYDTCSTLSVARYDLNPIRPVCP